MYKGERVMKTDLVISFTIPKGAVKLLKVVAEQNEVIKFDLDTDKNKLYLTTDILDFAEYSNDWDKLSDFDEYLKEVE